MTDDDLIRALTENGADAAGIKDRFRGGSALYASCFREFLTLPEQAQLADAVSRRAYERAFEAAHILKGASGNLGLTAYYRAVSGLVEALRSQDRESIAPRHAAVGRELESLRRLAAGGEHAAQ